MIWRTAGLWENTKEESANCNMKTNLSNYIKTCVNNPLLLLVWNIALSVSLKHDRVSVWDGDW